MQRRASTILIMFFMLFSFIVQNILFAASGTIEGVIKDSQSGDPLPFANVIIKGTSFGSSADVNGKFRIQNVPPGTYTLRASYIGYQTLEITVQITDGQNLKQDFRLKAEGVVGETVVVTAQAQGQNKAINEQLSAISIINVVSSARIQELPDANAAESVGRLPGVSVLRDGGEGSKIVIRGLSPKYNSIMVDGVRMPASDFNDRSSDLSMISPYMLDGIEVMKAITPDKDADVLGGSVNFKIKEAKEGLGADKQIGFAYDVLVQGGYNKIKSDIGDYKFMVTTSARMFDDKFGILAQIDLESRNRSANELGATYYLQGPVLGIDNPVKISGLNLTDYNRRKERKGGSLVLDYRLPQGKIVTSNFFSYASTKSMNRNESFSLGSNVKNYSLRDIVSKLNVMTNLLKIEQDFSPLKLEAKISHTFTDNNVPQNFGFTFYQQQVGLIDADPSVPPVQVPSYAKLDFTKTFLDQIGEVTDNSTDREITGNLDLTWNLSFSDFITSKIKFGGRYRYKDRVYTHYAAGGTLGLGSGQNLKDRILKQYPWMQETVPLGLPYLPLTLFTDNNVDFGDFLAGDYTMYGKLNAPILESILDLARGFNELEAYRASQVDLHKYNYDGNEYASAGYIMADISLGSQIQIIPGVRYENLKTSYTAPRGNSSYGDSPINYHHVDTTIDRTNGYLLPMLHVRYKPFDWFDVRFAYTNTLTYPDFKAIIPLIDIGYTSFEWNNVNLKAAKSKNLDLYLSIYDNSIGLLTIGGFYKEISDLIFPWSRFCENPADYEGVPSFVKNYSVSTYFNNQNVVKIKGLEVDWQTHFWYLPGILSGTVLNVNYTLISSEAKYPQSRYDIIYLMQPPWVIKKIVDTFYVNRMLDQPNDIMNISLGYDYEGFSIRFSMLYQANIFKGVNFWTELRQYTDDYTRFDISVKQSLPWFGLQLFCNINNLNGAKDITLDQGNGFPVTEQHYGMTIDLGLRCRF